LIRGRLVTALVVALIFVVLFSFVGVELFSKNAVNKPTVFVGVDVAYGDENAVYNVTEAVAGYANLIIIGDLQVTTDPAKLTRVCDYLYQKNFYFMIYVGFSRIIGFIPPKGPDREFFNRTAGRWGDKFLGIYLFDEIGGKQLDASQKIVNITELFPEVIIPRNYAYVAEAYVRSNIGENPINLGYYWPPYPKTAMSDYALYWYDYLSGYDTIFTEFAGNQSRQMAIALCRGAMHTLNADDARTQSQDWGVMITWKYNQAPFLEDASELYSDMILAYENDAKYIIVFNSPENQTNTSELGTLTTDHLDAMKKFWNYTKTNPRDQVYPADIAYVLPHDYGFGFRTPNDTIWGIWSADELSPRIWNDTNDLLSTYSSRLDIIYETKLDGESINLPYKTLIFWNGTTIQK
jgi:hypothetical protein